MGGDIYGGKGIWIYGYAESDVDVDALRAYAAVDIIKEIRALEASNALNISRATFYRLVKRYRQS